MKRFLLGAVAALTLAGCAGTDTAKTLAATDVTYSKIVAPLAADAIKSGKLGTADVAHVKAMSDQVHDALKDATADLAACPQSAGVIDPSCANSSAVNGALSAGTSALSDLGASLAANGFALPPSK